MITERIGRVWRRWKLQRAGAGIAADLQSGGPFFFGHAQGFSCGSEAYFAAGSRILIGECDRGFGRLTIGKRIFVNHYAVIDCHDEMVVGDDVLIGPHSYLCDFDHDVQIAVGPAIPKTGVTAPVHIGSRVWIGANVCILKGVSIGWGAVVGAGSVVTHDVPALAVVAGNPARVLRMRTEGSDAPRTDI